MEEIGFGQSAELGYIVDVDVDALDMLKVPQRYKEAKKTIINGVEAVGEAIKQSSYEIQFDFALKDKDGFTIETLHAENMPPLESGKRNTFQAKIDKPVSYATAIKVRDIWVTPLIERCFTCLPPTHPTQTTGTSHLLNVPQQKALTNVFTH